MAAHLQSGKSEHDDSEVPMLVSDRTGILLQLNSHAEANYSQNVAQNLTAHVHVEPYALGEGPDVSSGHDADGE